jgi:hypothetical protein
MIQVVKGIRYSGLVKTGSHPTNFHLCLTYFYTYYISFVHHILTDQSIYFLGNFVLFHQILSKHVVIKEYKKYKFFLLYFCETAII